MSVKLKAISLLLLGLLANNAFATTVNVSQVGNISTSGRNLSDVFLTVNWWDAEKNIGLLQFDLSAFSGASVGNAMLNLYHLWNVGTGAVFNLYENTSAWSPSINSWGDAPSHLSTPTAQLIIGDSSQELWRSVDVTNAVNDWTSGSLANYGFTLERVDQANPVVYFASNNIFGGGAPTLDLNNTEEPPSTVPLPAALPLMLSGMGILGFASRRRKETV